LRHRLKAATFFAFGFSTDRRESAALTRHLARHGCGVSGRLYSHALPIRRNARKMQPRKAQSKEVEIAALCRSAPEG
jgi:hypothetical protein